MNEIQKQIVEPFYKTLENPDMVKLTEIIMDSIDERNWARESSSTGKYHPEGEQGENGLLIHSMRVATIMNHILKLDYSVEKMIDYNNSFDNLKTFRMFNPDNSNGYGLSHSKIRDCLRIAALCHDGRRYGKEGNSTHSVFSHPEDMGWFLRKLADDKTAWELELYFIAELVSTHMGQWNCDTREMGRRLPVPHTNEQYLVHLADYLASRKDVIVDLEKGKL